MGLDARFFSRSEMAGKEPKLKRPWIWQTSPRMPSLLKGDVFISSFPLSTGGQGSEQKHFSLTVRQMERGRVLWSTPSCMIVITKAMKIKSKKVSNMESELASSLQVSPCLWSLFVTGTLANTLIYLLSLCQFQMNKDIHLLGPWVWLGWAWSGQSGQRQSWSVTSTVEVFNSNHGGMDTFYHLLTDMPLWEKIREVLI